MSTLADELLNDFEDSGSDGEGGKEEQENGGLFPDNENRTLHLSKENGGMELDGDEEDVDEEMAELNTKDDIEDEEETKAKVEKMQLGDVDDVRTVAGLMKKLEPVLKVSDKFLSPSSSQNIQGLHLLYCPLDLTLPRSYRKSPIFKHFHLTSRPPLLDQSKIIPSTICLPNPIHYRPLLTPKSYLCTSSSGITTLSVSPSWRL